MKKIMMKSLAVASFSAVALLAGCAQIEKDTPVNPSEAVESAEGDGNFEVTFECSMDDNSKTVFNGNEIWWKKGDEVHFGQYASVEGVMKYKIAYLTASSDKELLSATITFFNTPDIDTDSYYFSWFPAYNGYSDASGNIRATITTPDCQTPSDTCYDSASDLMISEYKKNLEKNGEGKYFVQLKYKRMVSIGKMKITNLPSDAAIDSIKFSAKNGANSVCLAGTSWYDFSTGEITSVPTKKYSIKLDYSALSPLANTAEGMTAYFCCYPFELAIGDSFKVIVYTKSGEIFTKDVTIPDTPAFAEGFKFERGKGTQFTVNMSNAVKTCSWFRVSKSSTEPTIDKVYGAIKKIGDVTLESVKKVTVSKSSFNSIDNLDTYIEAHGTSLVEDNITSLNSGNTLTLSTTGCSIDSEYVLIVKATDSSSRSVILTQELRSAWLKLAAATRGSGGIQIQIYGTGLSSESKSWIIVPTTSLDGISNLEQYYDSFSPANLSSSYISTINTNAGSVTAYGVTQYNLNNTTKAAMASSTNYTVMIKATNTRGETVFKTAAADAK